jgi:hypothetical protein
MNQQSCLPVYDEFDMCRMYQHYCSGHIPTTINNETVSSEEYYQARSLLSKAVCPYCQIGLREMQLPCPSGKRVRPLRGGRAVVAGGWGR